MLGLHRCGKSYQDVPSIKNLLADAFFYLRALFNFDAPKIAPIKDTTIISASTAKILNAPATIMEFPLGIISDNKETITPSLTPIPLGMKKTNAPISPDNALIPMAAKMFSMGNSKKVFIQKKNPTPLNKTEKMLIMKIFTAANGLMAVITVSVSLPLNFSYSVMNMRSGLSQKAKTLIAQTNRII